jgi:hypothetical protein
MSIEINGAGVITGVDSLSTPAVTNAAGSASAPSITFTGDGNTGLYSPGADQVAVTTGGTARLFVDASGRLLVGTSTSRGGWFNTSGQDSLIQTETTTQNVFSGVQNSNSALGPWILLGKSRGTTAGAVTVVQNDDPLGGITFQGADGTEMVDGCRIQAFVDGTPGANDLPTRLVFSTTADGASSPTERMRLASNGDLTCPGVYSNTTAAAANVVVSTSPYYILRSTSSIKYKTNVEDIDPAYSAKLLDCRPVWFRSTCSIDNPNWSHWGFIAEEVASIDPRLVHWKTKDRITQEDGTQVEIELDTPEPEGVQYDRFVPHLLNLIKRQGEAIADLQAEVAALKAQPS